MFDQITELTDKSVIDLEIVTTKKIIADRLANRSRPTHSRVHLWTNKYQREIETRRGARTKATKDDVNLSDDDQLGKRNKIRKHSEYLRCLTSCYPGIIHQGALWRLVRCCSPRSPLESSNNSTFAE